MSRWIVLHITLNKVLLHLVSHEISMHAFLFLSAAEAAKATAYEQILQSNVKAALNNNCVPTSQAGEKTVSIT